MRKKEEKNTLANRKSNLKAPPLYTMSFLLKLGTENCCFPLSSAQFFSPLVSFHPSFGFHRHLTGKVWCFCRKRPNNSVNKKGPRKFVCQVQSTPAERGFRWWLGVWLRQPEVRLRWWVVAWGLDHTNRWCCWKLRQNWGCVETWFRFPIIFSPSHVGCAYGWSLASKES